jgi:hypothetical protein
VIEPGAVINKSRLAQDLRVFFAGQVALWAPSPIQGSMAPANEQEPLVTEEVI